MTRTATTAWRMAIVMKPIAIETMAPRRTGTRVQKRVPSPPVRAMVMPAAVAVPVTKFTRSVQLTSIGFIVPRAMASFSTLMKTSWRL